jgi:aldehyde:ferredoxin oxidoreductase
MARDEAGAGKGFWGKILHVDLTARTITQENLDEGFYRKFLGGVGIGAKVLWDRMKPGLDPLGPENLLGGCQLRGVLLALGEALRCGRALFTRRKPCTSLPLCG